MQHTYIDIYQANSKIFVDIPILYFGDNFILRPILFNQMVAESESYLDIVKDEYIKEFLPEVSVRDIKDATCKLEDYIKRYLSYTCIPYVISLKDNNVPLGYILCHSPLCNYHNSSEKINQWTIDFWLWEAVRRKNIMSRALNRILQYLQEMEVPFVSIYTSKRNLKSIQVIKNNSFLFVGDTLDSKFFKFTLPLNNTTTM